MRRITTLTLIASGLSLTACGGTPNRGLESVHQPIVSRTDYTFDMASPSGGELSRGEASRLAGWFDSLKLRYGDRVSVDSPGGYGNARAAVGDVVARYGLLIEDQAPVTQGEIAPGSVRVVVSRMSASVPGCPDWSRASNPQFNGHMMSNYGCATNSNLASMVADPRDLIEGRAGPESVDASLSTKAIKTYRSAKPTGADGLKSQSTRGQ